MGKKHRLPRRLPKTTLRFFPNLKAYVITSPKDAGYNCIAFAASDTTRKWDPGMLPAPGYYWPPEALSDNNQDIPALKRMFAALGYEECETAAVESGFVKVALYAISSEDWLHAAIQEASGEWSSKLGNSYDIRHATPQCIEGPLYGSVCYLRKASSP